MGTGQRDGVKPPRQVRSISTSCRRGTCLPPFPIGVIGVFVVLVLFGVAAINLAGSVFAVTEEADASAQRLEAVNANAREYTTNVITAKDALLASQLAREQALRLETRIEDLRVELVALRVRFDRVATVTKGVLPPKVVVSVKFEDGKLNLAGSAPNYGDIVRYAEALRGAKGSDGEALFQDVGVKNVVSTDIGLSRESVVNFVIQAIPSVPKAEGGSEGAE